MIDPLDILSRFTTDEQDLLRRYFMNDLGKKTKTTIIRKNFSHEDDDRLSNIVRCCKRPIKWEEVAEKMGDYSSRQCRERWTKFLDPSINTSPWTQEEDEILLNKYNEIGAKWTAISRFLKGRSDVSIKNRWLHLVKKTLTGKLN